MKKLFACLLFVELALSLCSLTADAQGCANGQCSVRRPVLRLPILGIRGRIAARRI